MKSLKDFITEVNQERQSVIDGTNCFNCSYTRNSKAHPVDVSEMNAQGGLDPKDAAGLQRAKKGDLVTLPGKEIPKNKKMCGHRLIKMYVTERNCCAYWDNPGCLRAWKE